MFASALIAGCAAWLLAAVLHFAFVQEYILLGETYETGAAVHFGSAVAAADGHEHTHETGAVAHDHGANDPGAHDPAANDLGAHDHGEAATAVMRNGWTVLFTGLVYVAYAMILVAGFGLARIYGRVIDARAGLLWGIAGFAAFQLAPAMGLAPELPGTAAADLGARQVWWWATVAATGTGLALLAYGHGVVTVAVAAMLLAAPHVIGAPMLEGFGGVAPPEVAAAFSARVLGVGLVVWSVMGWVAGYVWGDEKAMRGALA